LFIVKQVIERNKGRISVKSKEGQGTTFMLEFPILDMAVLEAARKAAEAEKKAAEKG